MKGYRIARKIGLGLVFGIVAAGVLGIAVMLLWNGLIPELFHGPVLSYWQALGLLVLAHLLFHRGGHWRPRDRWRRERWKEEFERRLAGLTPEEREQHWKSWMEHCWTPGTPHTPPGGTGQH
jgi:hypothetical protein